MVVHRESSALSRELGAELRKAREKAGYVGYQLANRLGWSASKISRAETGLQPLSEADTVIFASYCRTESKELKYLAELAREVGQAYYLRPHGSALPDELRTLIAMETTATASVNFEIGRVPGLLQTEDYARALLHAGTLPKKDVEARVLARMDRQNAQIRTKPGHTFLIHEHALRLPVGGFRVMHEQCMRLLFEVHRVRVIPTYAGAHAGMSGPFVILQTAEQRPVIHVELPTLSLFLEGPRDVATHLSAAEKLTNVALNEGQTRELIARLANDYDQPEEPSTLPSV